jgi:hypothetical protein
LYPNQQLINRFFLIKKTALPGLSVWQGGDN